jgi:CubicO group peptidase (beta-lactamase class C family)
MDSLRLRQAVDFLIAEKDVYRPHQVVVVRHGRRVLDVCFYPFMRGWRHDLASVTKAVTGAVVGAAVHAGFIRSMDEPVLGYFPDRAIANRDADKEAITLSNLLEQRSGLAAPDYARADELERAMYASDDWVQWILDQPMVEAPGWGHLYTSWNPHLAAAVVAQAVGMTPLEFGRRSLFGPLGIRDLVWPADPQGINYGFGDAQLLPLDLAKLGQLYLDMGTWKGQQVLDPSWIERATSPGTGPNPLGWPAEIRVGYHWEIAADYYSATGSGGQVVRVFPTRDVVVVLVAGGGSGYANNTYSSLAEVLCGAYLMPAIRSSAPLPANPAGVTALADKVAAAALSDEGVPQPVPPPPAVASTVSGRRYVMEPNPLELYSFTLTFGDGPEAVLEFSSAGSASLDMAIGLDGVFRFFPGERGTTWRAKGWWELPSTFVILLDQIALYHYLRFACSFVGDTAVITAEDLSGTSPSLSMVGRAE